MSGCLLLSHCIPSQIPSVTSVIYNQMKKVSQIFLVVGYLGAGKTTFIKNLVKQDKIASRLAVIQNEFSEQMGIEAPMIVNSEGTPFKDFLELPNGCICCSAKNDLLAAIEYLCEKGNIEYIVVETNGVADPAQSIKQFWMDESMEIPAKLHSIVTIVPTHRLQQIKDDPIFKKEIVFSNKAILGFLDRVTLQEKQQALDYIKQLNPLITIEEATDPDLYEKVFQGDFFEIQSLSTLDSHSHNHQDIQSIVMTLEQLPDLKTLQRNIGVLLWEKPQFQIMRIKGMLLLKESPFLHQLQGVDDTFEIHPTTIPKSSFSTSKILAIGKHLERDQIFKTISGT